MRPTALALLLLFSPAFAQSLNPEPLGIALENYAYPHPVRFFPVTVEGQDLRMAYMDVAPTGSANGQTVLLLHGKNFFGSYWAATIQALTAAVEIYCDGAVADIVDQLFTLSYGLSL